MEKIKILFLTSVFAKMGGAERNIYDIVCNIDMERFTPYVICLKGGELVEDIKSKGIYAEIIDLEKIFSLKSIIKGIRLYKFLKRKKIQVVLTYHHDADIWGGITAILAMVPVVISNRRDLGYQLQRKHIWAYKILNKFYTKIISVSEATKREIIRREWTSPEKIITIYNGVKYKDFQNEASEDYFLAQKESFGINPGETVLGAIGAFRPIKGQIYLVKAVSEIIKRYDKIKVLFVGYNKTEYYEEVKRLINKKGLEKYFIFTGDIHDVPKVLSIIDIFVLPSISEGFSNAVLEAMATAKPVIATNSGGNPEAIIHNKTGFLVPPCDSVALSEAIQKLLENEALRQKMGYDGRIRVIKTFTLQTMLANLKDLYEGLYLSNKSKTRCNYYINKQRLKKFIKILLSHFLYLTNIANIYKKMYSKKFRILTYHSINNISLQPLEIEQATKNFEEQMLYLKKNFQILSLTDFLDYRNKGKQFPDNSVLLTFDDGYRDNYINAFPVLKTHKIPAVIFLTTDVIDNHDLLFFDALRFGIQKSSRLILDLRDIGLAKYILDRNNELLLAKIIKDIVDFSKRIDNASKTGLICSIYNRLDLDLDELKKESIYLSWDEISEMAKNGIEFGSHTKTHPQLSSLSFQECKAEMVYSKEIIEKKIGKEVRTLAYPFGGNKDFNELAERAAKEAGYECAFSLLHNKNGLNPNAYTVGRKMVDSNMSTTFSGIFCKPLFAVDLIGIYNR